MATAMRDRGGMARAAASDSSAFLRRWIMVWVALLAVVTLVVVVFLVNITNSLASINASLAVADDAVSTIGGETKTLPGEVETVNNSLAGIDPNLKPIPGQADAIIASLVSINDRLTNVDRSLVDTSSVLTTVLGQTGTIRGILVDADDPADKFGVQNIHQRVARVNGVGDRGSFAAIPDHLTAAEGDTTHILGQLNGGVNPHLRGICRNTAVGLLTGSTKNCG